MENVIIEATVHTNNLNHYSVSELNYLRDYIENMDKFNQIEILRILHKHKDITLNENKYGIHVNLSELNENILKEIMLYLDYIKNQEKNLIEIEQQKEDFKNTYFSNNIKENS
jgi:hypothetical protein